MNYRIVLLMFFVIFLNGCGVDNNNKFSLEGLSEMTESINQAETERELVNMDAFKQAELITKIEGKNGASLLFSLNENESKDVKMQKMIQKAAYLASVRRDQIDYKKIYDFKNDKNKPPVVFCDSKNCLKSVSQNIEFHEKQIKEYKYVLNNAVELKDYKNFLSPLGHEFLAPGYDFLNFISTAAALHIAKNEINEGLEMACIGARVGRNIMHGSGDLIGTIIGNKMALDNSILIKEALARRSDKSSAFPGECVLLGMEEFNLAKATCNGMKNEAMQFVSMTSHNITPDVKEKYTFYTDYVYNEKKLIDNSIKPLLNYCSDEVQKSIASGNFVAPKKVESGICYTPKVNCVLQSINIAKYESYVFRMIDNTVKTQANIDILKKSEKDWRFAGGRNVYWSVVSQEKQKQSKTVNSGK